jgi:pimeloyl-ACP methyl ester carboxylesterase
MARIGALPRVMAAATLALGCAACSATRTIEASKLGLDAAAGTRNAAQVLALRRPVQLAGQPGDLYLSGEAPLAALVMVPGVTPEGRDDPRLIAFAGSLARHRFLVFVPELPGLREQRVGRDDPAAISRAANALATCFTDGSRPRLGVVAISYAVGPAVIAALDEVGGQRIGLIVGIGGYHDVVSAITYLTTGYYRPAPGAPWYPGSPEALARWVFVLASAPHVPDLQDRELLTRIARAKLEDPTSDTRPTEAGLHAGGQAMLALATNLDPERVPGLIMALPEPLRGDIDSLDLAKRPLQDLHARLLLIHGRDDPLIPATESLALAAAVPPGQAETFVVGNLSHVEIHPGGIRDTVLLWQAAYRLLTLRGALTVPDPTRCAVGVTAAVSP